MVYDVVTDAAKKRASDGVETSSAHHNQLRLLRLGHVNNALTGTLARRLTANFVLYLPQSHTRTHAQPLRTGRLY